MPATGDPKSGRPGQDAVGTKLVRSGLNSMQSWVVIRTDFVCSSWHWYETDEEFKDVPKASMKIRIMQATGGKVWKNLSKWAGDDPKSVQV